MKRRSKGTPPLDFNIHGDEQEAYRIQLENNLQNTEIDFHLSSTSDEDAPGGGHPSRRTPNLHNSSVEYPRHAPDPDAMPEFPGFPRSRDFGDDDLNNSHSGMRGWSYRTGEDDEGVNPYSGESISTAAHHASVLTIGAGLGGGRGARRSPSLSGAEYDPERPLSAMIAGVNSKHTMLDLDSKYDTADPLVVDNTAELDKILESGHAQPPSMRSRSVRLVSPLSSTSSSSSDTEDAQVLAQGSPRPKLSDHLGQTSFSPKRPRTMPLNNAPTSPLARHSRVQEDLTSSMYMPTPRPLRTAHVQPEVRLQPATPSTVASRASRAAKERSRANTSVHHTTRPSSAPPERNPFQVSTNAADQSHVPPPSRRTPARNTSIRNTSVRNTPNGKVYLPDVTGLTQAVESPAKPGLEYLRYRADDRPRESEARLLQTLSAVQHQLRGLEEENGISRRRVHELELELEECKREVVRERTRLIQRENLSFRQPQVDPRTKGTTKAGPAEIDDERLRERYKEAVEEKKALEALIQSLRSHLTRLTTELASHQDLLSELKKLRDADAKTLREKSTEITQLKKEVERLAGEVEVLRGVVEEGLKERRASRDIQMVETSQADTAMSQDLDDDEDEGEQDEEAPASEDEDDDSRDGEPFDDDDASVSSLISFASVPQQQTRPHHADRTMRTDFATLGSSQFAQSTGPRIVNDEELQRIAAEVDERRANMSIASIPHPRSPSPVRSSRRAPVTVEEEADDDTIQTRPLQRAPPQPPSPLAVRHQPEQATSRPSAPTPGHATRHYEPLASDGQAEAEAPFPQIRGEQLEKLFFSAPEHNARTCTVCYRRRHRNSNGSAGPSWSAKVHQSHPVQQQRQPQKYHAESDDEDDEGFAEGSVSDHAEHATNGKGKQREFAQFSKEANHWRKVGHDKGLPPQTVLARVIRELEDDFTHYKSVYVELADQYKIMDAVSDVPRRNLLANHLREVVDILEQKGDQIAALYDLLSFKDKPVTESVVLEKERPAWGGVF